MGDRLYDQVFSKTTVISDLLWLLLLTVEEPRPGFMALCLLSWPFPKDVFISYILGLGDLVVIILGK